MQIVTHVLTSPQSELRADTEEASARRKAARQNIGAVAGIKTESGPIEPDSEGYVQIPEVVDADENTKGIVKLTDDPTSEAANTAASPAAIRTALANFGGFKVVTLDPETEEPAVPLEERSTKYIYLTKDSDSHETDPYTEWIWVVEEAPAEPHWDIIGTTSVDLSGYAQKSFVESFIAPNYDPTKTVYYQGEICMYEDKCYRAKNIIRNNGSAIGTFDSSKWAETNFADSRLQILNYYVTYEWPSAEVTNKAIQSGSLVGLRYITPANPQYYEKENTMYWLHSYYMDDAGNISATFLNTEPTIYTEPEYVEYNSITYSIIKYTSSGNEHWTKENGLRCPFYTYDDQYKLSGIAEGAQVNKIESISANSTALRIDADKNVDIPLATANSDGLLPKEKFPLIPVAPVAGADRIYSFDDDTGTSWQTIVKEYVGNMILDQLGNPVTDEKGEIMYEEEAVPLWLSYKGVEFGARRAYADQDGHNIKATYLKKTEFHEPEEASEADIKALFYDMGTVEIGGRTYKTVIIGDQEWLAENLDYKFTGLDVGHVERDYSIPKAAYYDNDEATYGVDGNKYGLLYNWTAVDYLNTNRATLCNGWHVPSRDDWDVLISAVGESPSTKLRSETGWESRWYAGTDDFGFNAKPCGYSISQFFSVGWRASFWTSDAKDSSSAYYKYFHSGPDVSENDQVRYLGYSVRLVRDSV